MKKIFTILILTTLLAGNIFAETYVVVVNKNNTEDVDVKARFLLNKESWANNGTVNVYEMSAGDVGHKAFLNKVLKIDAGAYSTHWNDRKSAGKTNKPTVVKSTSYMFRFIKNKKGAIGYLPQAQATGLRIISTFEVP